MIKREITKELLVQLQEYPIVTVLGPRQSGKTTLVRNVLPEYDYVSLEDPDNRELAIEDPKAFLKRYQGKTIFDEIQRTPNLLSYLQGIVDNENINGRFVLTGSHQLELRAAVSQSLAGRTGILHLLPLSIAELKSASIEFDDFESYVVHGFLPRIYDQNQRPSRAYSNYYQTYIERDVRSIINVGDLDTFGRFIRLCAGRTGQLINFSSLAADCGISNMTAKRWLSVLQASFIIAQVRPHYENFSKRLIKSPKLYFLDTGLLSFLLGIRSTEELRYHSLRGSIFESYVFSELYKLFLNQGQIPDIYFWQDISRHEVDFIIDRGSKVLPIEVKSGETLVSDSFKGLKYFKELSNTKSERPVLIYGGNDNYIRNDIQVLSWQNL